MASDFSSDKFLRLFRAPIADIVERVHPTLTATDDALQFIESLALQLLQMLVVPHVPHTVSDVEEHVMRTFPAPLNAEAVDELRTRIQRKARSNPTMDKLHALMAREMIGQKIELSVTHALFTIVEFVLNEIVSLSGRFVFNCRSHQITRDDVRVAMCADTLLMELFDSDNDRPMIRVTNDRSQMTYEEIVKDTVRSERLFQRDLQLIIKVFRHSLTERMGAGVSELFANIDEVYDLSVSLMSSLEDSLEASLDGCDTLCTVGTVFEEIAETCEFDAFERYTREMNAGKLRQKLREITGDVNGIPMIAFRYALPKLMTIPVSHAFTYFDTIHLLSQRAPSRDDCDTLQQSEGLLSPLRALLERTEQQQRPVLRRFHSELQINGRLIYEGIVQRVQNNRRPSERYAVLFESQLILSKIRNDLYRIKEKFPIRSFSVVVETDADETTFDLVSRDSRITLIARSPDDAQQWLSHLALLCTRHQLDRRLDAILAEEEQKHPLQLPSSSSSSYRFAETDEINVNIVFESDARAPIPVIRGATIHKLIERLTYHQYADPTFVRLFLTTFRSFCTPNDLIDLLCERFDIPEPIGTREQLKRFRTEYQQPVQFRVLNVLRHWIDHHFYDFERDASLLERLNQFLDERVRARAMRKWVDSIRKVVQRRLLARETLTCHTFASSPPPVEWHVTRDPSLFDIVTLHPIELARQLTLLEFELYCAVKPYELIGSGAGESVVWTRKDKHKTSPNLLRMIRHSSNFVFWMERTVVETHNHEERVSVVQRIIEIMCVLHELNNFNGVLECVSALNSACVHRLEHTFSAITSNRLRNALKDAKELTDDHFRRYHERLRSINPPCVPFFGNYLTQILHIEEGNSDFLHPNQLINFSKRRKVAEITSEIEQYQNQPYCLTQIPEIRAFLTAIDPFQALTDEKELNDYLYAQSLECEPRYSKCPPKFARRWPDTNLKSPGVKGSRTRLPAPLDAIRNTINAHVHSNERESGGESDTIASPSTPLTPPDTVFASVLIGSIPPPLPPRRTRTSDSEPPPLPPKCIPRYESRPLHRPNASLLRRSSDTIPPQLPPKTHKSRDSAAV